MLDWDEGFNMEPTGVHLWLVLWKAYQALLCHAERHIHSLGLGFSDFAVLEVLLHKGPAPVNTIGQLVHLTSGSITAAIDRLERKSLVAGGGAPDERGGGARRRSIGPAGAGGPSHGGGPGTDRVRVPGSRGGHGGCDHWALRRGEGRSGGAAEEVGAECTGAVKQPGQSFPRAMAIV